LPDRVLLPLEHGVAGRASWSLSVAGRGVAGLGLGLGRLSLASRGGRGWCASGRLLRVENGAAAAKM